MPIALMWIGLALGAFSTISQTVAAYQAQDAQNKQLEYQARVAENNAMAMEYEAKEAEADAQLKAEEQRRKTRMVLGQQRAAQGASGLLVDSGSFGELTLDTIEYGKYDELAILHEGDMDAWRYRTRGQGFTNQASLYRANKSSPSMAALGTFISSAAGVAGNAYMMMRGPSSSPTGGTPSGGGGFVKSDFGYNRTQFVH